MIKYLECIIESGIFAGIDKSEYIDALECISVTSKNFMKGYTVFYEGDIIDKVCIINRGSIRGEKNYLHGEVHILELFEEGSIFGLDAALSKLQTAPVDYVCNDDCVIVFIALNSLRKSMYSEAIMETLLQKIADDSIRKNRKIEILAEKGLRNRILIYLDILSRKAGGPEVTVEMNREQLAQYLCVNRSALSNELNKMKREKLIDFDKKNFVIYKKTYIE